MKTAVMTDSTAYLSDDLIKQYNIHVIPLNVVFGETSYREGLDITNEEFYQKVRNADELPKTSQPPLGLITNTFKELAKDYDAVIAIHLSSGISGTYQSVINAGSTVDGIEVYAFDSGLSCMGQGFFVLEAAEMVQQGRSPEAIMERLYAINQTIRAYFMVDDLSHLQRGGRLNGAQAILGSMLKVKPILHFVDKQIVPFENIRTSKKALKRIMDMLREDAASGKDLKVAFIHANNEAGAFELKASFDSEYPNMDTSISYFGPVIGTHLGEGALGVCWYVK